MSQFRSFAGSMSPKKDKKPSMEERADDVVNRISADVIQAFQDQSTPSGQPSNKTSDQPTIWPSVQPSNRPTERQTNRPTERPPKRPTNHPTNHPTSTDFFTDPVWNITVNQAKILSFLINQKNGVTCRRAIINSTGIPEGTVKDSIRVLIQKKFISKPKKFHEGRFQGFKYNINDELCGRFLSERWNQPTDHPAIHTTDNPSIWPSDLLEEDRYNSILLLEKINTIYPNLHNIGFERSQLEDVIQSWKANKLDLDQLPESLQRADYAVLNKSFKMNDPLNYVYSALMKGLFRKPAGFKSRAEMQAEELLAEQKHIAEMRDEAFNLWCENLSPEKRTEHCKGVPKIKQRVRLREVFDSE